MFRRDAYVYVGVDVHKSAHVGMMVDCFGDPMGKALKVANQVSAFPGWVETIQKRAEGKGVLFGLEDVHGLGRALATYLLSRGYTVKFANAYLTKKERDSVNKTDRNDALAVARTTAKQFFTLPDADVDELQWALIQAVHYRRGLVEEQTRVKNRLHAFLNDSHPAYLTFFSEEFGKTALAFWERYPAASSLAGVTVDDLGKFLREVSHYALGFKQAEKILSACQGAESRGFQQERDYLIRSAVRELRHLDEQLTEGRAQLERLVNLTDYRLTDIPGIDVVMSAELIALVGDVTRFRNVDRFLAYTGIAPVAYGTGDHETRLRSQFGRRELMALFHRIASTQLVTHHKTKEPRNPEAKAYFDKCLGDQAKLPKEKQDKKVRKKALLSLMRAQVRRFYNLMKRQKLTARERRAQEGSGAA
ncbi:MAG TPA: IS110 family transposase [Symbiobacteriaceae bacterium]|nr:IS110 family transposase [Symbiobacteriaceae bacterium]